MFQEKAIAGAKATDEVIEDNPYKAIGIALGWGRSSVICCVVANDEVIRTSLDNGLSLGGATKDCATGR